MRGSSLHSIVNCLFNPSSHRCSIPSNLVSRNPQYLVPLLCQVLVAALVKFAAFVGLMMRTIDLNDQLQIQAAKIDGRRRDWIFTTKLLVSTTTIPQHLPHVSRKLVRGGVLMTSELNRVLVTLQSSVHDASVTGRCRLLAPSSPALLPLQGRRAPLAFMEGGEGSQFRVGISESPLLRRCAGEAPQFASAL